MRRCEGERTGEAVEEGRARETLGDVEPSVQGLRGREPGPASAPWGASEFPRPLETRRSAGGGACRAATRRDWLFSAALQAEVEADGSGAARSEGVSCVNSVLPRRGLGGSFPGQGRAWDREAERLAARGGSEVDPSGPLACWPIAARSPASGGGILGCEAAGIRAHVLLCLLRAEAVAGAGCGVLREA